MPDSKSKQSITTYLPRDLSERLEKARSAGEIDTKEVIKAALYAALDGKWPPVPVTGPEDENIAYELVFAEDKQESQARLDSITQAGGKPLSVAINSKDQFCLLVAWRTG